MNVIFLKSKTFLAQEMENALKKRKDINLLITNIPEKIPSESAASVVEQMGNYLPAIVISINNAGYDLQGALSDLFASGGSYQCNWFLDDPFYEDIFYNSRTPNMKNRIDFVSEESFVPRLREKGYHAYFLPLATDPQYFNSEGNVDYARDCSFVGNSSLNFLDELITKDVAKELEHHVEIINDLKWLYYTDPSNANVKNRLRNTAFTWENTTKIDRRRFMFCVEWLVGFFYRRDFIIQIAKRLKNRFKCFGDIYWSKFIDPSQVSTDACYYTNLSRYYRSTKVNLNINRIQIRTSFTQRIFDCKASGAFILTEKRRNNKRFFVTEGDNKELVEFSSWPECLNLIDYYCAHGDEREKIAKAGKEKVLAEHTYDNRLDSIFESCRKEWGI
jgi:spore maturation protein CgeB